MEQAEVYATEARELFDLIGISPGATASGLGPDTYDLVHARTPLLNVNNPQQILAEMIRIARPGGIIALQEPDPSAWTCDPPQPAFDILGTEIINATDAPARTSVSGGGSLACCERLGSPTSAFAPPPASLR